MAESSRRVGAYPTPPAAPRKKIADPLPARFSTDVSAEDGSKRTLRDVALKTRGPIAPRSMGKGRR